jgi:predicted nucleic acid-binding Zn ribbon protein
MTTRKKTYTLNKSRKVGESCICPICGKAFIKGHYAQAFCSNDCKVKYHNDKQRGKRNGYFRRYNMKHPERYERVGIDLAFERWKANYYNDSILHQEDGENIVTIDRDYLISLYEQETGNMYNGI